MKQNRGLLIYTEKERERESGPSRMKTGSFFTFSLHHPQNIINFGPNKTHTSCPIRSLCFDFSVSLCFCFCFLFFIFNLFFFPLFIGKKIKSFFFFPLKKLKLFSGIANFFFFTVGQTILFNFSNELKVDPKSRKSVSRKLKQNYFVGLLPNKFN